MAGDGEKSRHRSPALHPGRDALKADGAQSGAQNSATNMTLSVGVAQVPREFDIADLTVGRMITTGAAFNRESKKSGSIEYSGSRRYDGFQISDINQDVRRDDKIVGCLMRPFEESPQLADFETVVYAARSRKLDHSFRQLDPDEVPGKRTKRGTGEPGTTAEIEHTSKVRRTISLRANVSDRITHQFGSAIRQIVNERCVEARSILIE